jgi:hypothetical protein
LYKTIKPSYKSLQTRVHQTFLAPSGLKRVPRLVAVGCVSVENGQKRAELTGDPNDMVDLEAPQPLYL